MVHYAQRKRKQNMIGAIGFIAAAILFGVYASSAYRQGELKGIRVLSYSLAYICLSMACFTWALTALLGNDFLKPGVLLGDIFVLIGTVLLIDSVLNSKWRWPVVSLVSVLLGAGFVYRAVQHPVEATISNGILLFQTPKSVAIGLSILFVSAWLLVTMRFVSRSIEASGIVYAKNAALFSAAVACLGVLAFMGAKDVTATVVSFLVMLCGYASLIAIDFYTSRSA